jgi:hypothetical protein
MGNVKSFFSARGQQQRGGNSQDKSLGDAVNSPYKSSQHPGSSGGIGVSNTNQNSVSSPNNAHTGNRSAGGQNSLQGMFSPRR